MNALPTWLRTLAALGTANLARVAAYRVGLKLGVHPVQRLAGKLPPGGPFFERPTAVTDLRVPDHWRDEARLFGAHKRPIGAAPPNWTVDPLGQEESAASLPSSLAPWWTINDFGGGDIKSVWEFSRFDWALPFAQQARAGEQGALERLEHWVADWVGSNPAYRGPNWKCAQEASIRLMHLALAALLLGTEARMTTAMRAVVGAHARRILPTLSYARAQENNHATSEAGALFIAGAWLRIAGAPGADELLHRATALVERTTLRLFAADGSFSQHSVNYHRVALDTTSMVELWRRRAGLAPFSADWQARARAASDWLRIMIDPVSGDAPNLGANDGANLLPLTDAPYRDFRQSAQIASVLFAGCRAFPPGPWDDALRWLGIKLPQETASLPARAVFDDGGYAVLRQGSAMAMLRYPRFRFRPSQADVLHLDLSYAGENLLRDGGSYSYNADSAWIEYFGGVGSHNTIEFDGTPQMVRLSRFLLGDWLTTEARGETAEGFFASYRSRRGWRHHRQIALSEHLTVTDTVDGFATEARLRWRLAPGPWEVREGVLTNGRHRMSIRADVPISVSLVEGWESRDYFKKTSLPVVEAVVTEPGQILTEYRWAP